MEAANTLRGYLGFPAMADVLPDGASHGAATVHHLRVDAEEAGRTHLLALLRGGRGAQRPGSVVAQLRVNGRLWMSDTPDERADHCAALRHLRGRVLVGGLGLGMVTLAALQKPEVEAVTVLELNPDVVALVEPHLRRAAGERASRLTVHVADVFAWEPPPGAVYDAAWMDVWSVLSTEDLGAHARCSRRYRRKLAPGGWFGCWGHALLQQRRRAELRELRAAKTWSRAWK